MEKIVHILYDKILTFVIWVIGAVMFACIIIQIITRSFFRVPFSWTDELARFTFLWFCFTGGVLTLRYKLHLGIDYFETKMPPRARFINRIFVYSMIIIFGLFVGILGTRLMGIVGAQLTPVMRMPMRYVYLSLPLSGFLYVFLGVYQLYCHLAGKPYDVDIQETPKEVLEAAAETLRGKKQ